MIPLLLANRKLIGYGLIVAGLLAGSLWLRSHWIGVGEGRIEAQYQAAWAQAELEARVVREKDQEARKSLSNTLEALGTAYANLRNLPPIVTTQIRYVPAQIGNDNAPTCPVSTLSPDFRLRFNQAALNP